MKIYDLGYRGRVLGTVAGLLALPAFVAPRVNVSVWSGVYSENQAERGREAFGTLCAMCHSADLSGRGPIPALRGASFTENRHGSSVGELYGYIRTAMPPGRPGQLAPEAYADIVAYLLSANAYPAGEGDLPHAEDVLHGILFDAGPANAQE